jgi:hypothetical protein
MLWTRGYAGRPSNHLYALTRSQTAIRQPRHARSHRTPLAPTAFPEKMAIVAGTAPDGVRDDSVMGSGARSITA